MGAFRIAALVGTLLAANAAVAQTTPAEPPPVPQGDVAWDRYHAAFVLLARGDREQAAALLAELRAQFPGHPAAIEAEARLASLGQTAPPKITDEQPITDPLRQERNTGGARAEVILFQTIHGAFLAAELCAAIECDDARLQAAIGLLGVGVGLAGSYYLTRDGITSGHTEVLDSAVIWGAWNGLLVNDLIGSGDGFDGDQPGFFGVLAVSQLVGLGTGEVLWRAFRPTSAQVATANTAGFWTTILTLMVFGIADTEPEIPALVVAGDVGLGLGAVLSSSRPMSRGRTYLVDAGGVIGVLVGLLVGVGTENATTAFSATLVGTTVGLGAAIYLTRDWDDRPVQVPNVGRLTLTPLPDRGIGAAWVFPLDL